MATAAFLRCAGALRRILWLHDCFWPSRRWRFDAARVANAVELSADAAGAAVRGFLPDFARANNSDGFDAAGASLRTPCSEKQSLAARLVFFTGQTRWGRCLARFSAKRI